MSAWLPRLLEGLLVTVEATVLGFALAVIVSFTVGLALEIPSRAVRAVLRMYVEVFRGTSALVQIFYFFYVLPLLGVELDAMTAGVLALGLNFGAYGSEIVRGAIAGVPRGQREAALALGLKPVSTMRRIILPQAVLAMIPPFGNVLIDLMKATSLLSLITVSDLAFVGREILQARGNALEAYLPLLVLYFALAVVLGRLVQRTERYTIRKLV
jgi:polar amino acid transport system permease protein